MEIYNEANDLKLMVNKSKILKKYEEVNKDLIPFSKLKAKPYSKISSGNYVELDKYSVKTNIKDIINASDGVLNTPTTPVGYNGYEYNDKTIFVLEQYIEGFTIVNGVPIPKFIFKIVPIDSSSKKHEGYYLNKIKYKLNMQDAKKAKDFLSDQYNKLLSK